MAEQKAYNEQEKLEILWDAARCGVLKTAEEYDVPASTIYGWTYKEPELWNSLKAKIRPVIELDVYEMANLAAQEIAKRFKENPAQFKAGELVSIFKGAWSGVERIDRMDKLVANIGDLLTSIRSGSQEALDMLKEAIPKLSEEDCQTIIDNCTRKTDGDPSEPGD